MLDFEIYPEVFVAPFSGILVLFAVLWTASNMLKLARS